MEAHISDVVARDEYGLYLDRLAQGYARIVCSQEIMHAYDEKIEFRSLRNRLKRICENETMAAVLRGYPWYKLPLFWVRKTIWKCPTASMPMTQFPQAGRSKL